MLQRFTVVLITIACLIGVAAAAQQRPTQTILEGGYTEAQAERGRELFAVNCARCHEGICPDGPPLVGPLFVERWREDHLGSLFTWAKSRMPRNAAGSLSDQTYLDTIAFLLKENEYPAGNTELSTANMSNLLIVGKAGPRPLPPNSLVLVVGCFAQDATEGWRLNNATDPVRNRYGSETSPEELRASEAKAAGTQTYQLQNVGELAGFNPASLSGRRVQVKGSLGRQGQGARIIVTSIEPLAGTCR
jgi:hypothetical protein